VTEIVTHDDVDGAVTELAALTCVPAPLLWEAVYEQGGGGRDEVSLSRGVTAVAEALQDSGVDLSGPLMPDGFTAWPATQAEQDLALSMTYAENKYGELVALTDYSAEERRELAAKGWALPGGNYQ
jgi:hypothetical protein